MTKKAELHLPECGRQTFESRILTEDLQTPIVIEEPSAYKTKEYEYTPIASLEEFEMLVDSPFNDQFCEEDSMKDWQAPETPPESVHSNYDEVIEPKVYFSQDYEDGQKFFDEVQSNVQSTDIFKDNSMLDPEVFCSFNDEEFEKIYSQSIIIGNPMMGGPPICQIQPKVLNDHSYTLDQNNNDNAEIVAEEDKVLLRLSMPIDVHAELVSTPEVENLVLDLETAYKNACGGSNQNTQPVNMISTTNQEYVQRTEIYEAKQTNSTVFETPAPSPQKRSRQNSEASSVAEPEPRRKRQRSTPMKYADAGEDDEFSPKKPRGRPPKKTDEILDEKTMTKDQLKRLKNNLASRRSRHSHKEKVEGTKHEEDQLRAKLRILKADLAALEIEDEKWHRGLLRLVNL